MAGKFLEIAVILTAMDKMSGVVTGATRKSGAAFDQLANRQERAGKAMGNFKSYGMAAAIGGAAIAGLTGAYGDLQEAQLAVRNSMMQPGGIVNESDFKKNIDFAEQLSTKYAGTQQSYLEMINTFQQNRLKPSDIWGPIGDSASKLGDLLGIMPAESAQLLARLKTDSGAKAGEIPELADMIVRLKNSGMGQTGSEVVANMTHLYAGLGMSMNVLGMHGAKAAKEIGTLGGMMISMGMEAPTASTNLRKMLLGIGDPDKLKKMNDELAVFGKHVHFFDQKGKWEGVDNFVAQLGTLSDLSESQLSKALSPISPKGGVAKVMAMYLAKNPDAFMKYTEWGGSRGSMNDQFTTMASGQNYQTKLLATDFTNLAAALGKLNAPAVRGGLEALTGGVLKITKSAEGGSFWAKSLVYIADGITALLGAAALVSLAKWTSLTLGIGKFFTFIGNSTVFQAGVTAITGVFESLAVAAIGAGAAVTALTAGLVAGFAGLGYAIYKGIKEQEALLAAGGPYDKKYTPVSQSTIDAFKKRDSPVNHWHYAPTLNISGTATSAKEVKKVLDDHVLNFKKIVKGSDSDIRAYFH